MGLRGTEGVKGYDLIVMGSGMGGGTLTHALSRCGLRIALLERGGFLPRERQNWDVQAVFRAKRYKAAEQWLDASGRRFDSSMHYYVGGSTKMYGAALLRLRKEDFGLLQHAEGESPPWPISYEDLAPYYQEAERLYLVHGSPEGDPGGPRRAEALPYPAVEDEPYVAQLRLRLEALGLKPGSLPLGVELQKDGRCIRCDTCDGFPCLVNGKADAELRCVRPALETGNVDLFTGVEVRRLITDAGGRRVIRAEGVREGRPFALEGDTFVVSCGAVNSAALLLRSHGAAHPQGLGNSCGMVGRNYMAHLNSAVLAVDPRRVNPTVFQKTLILNDYYLSGGERWGFPLGSLQLLGKAKPEMLQASAAMLPGWLARFMASHSVDWWATSEDLPSPENRVELAADGNVRLSWKPRNLTAHRALLQAARDLLRRAGYAAVFVKRMGIGANSHQCGTVRFGADPASSAIDPFCRSHEVPNLYVVDGSFFPSSGAVNPALTIAAQALRVADRLKAELGAGRTAPPPAQPS